MGDRGYETFLSGNGKYVVIDVLEPMTIDLGRRCGKAATALATSKGIDRYLFDLRGAPNVETIHPNYEFAYKDLEGFGFPRGSRSAMLTDPDDSTHDFMETLFLNAGYQVKVFRDEASAIAWLEHP